MTPPRLHVITATGCDMALVLRRGPTRAVASLSWNRATGEVTLGQWLRGRIYEHRSDLSPDGRHAIYFAGNGQRWWTAISRAPWLRAVYFAPKGDTWHGGGAFTADGRVFLNGASAPDDLPDGLRPAPDDAYPHGTDGFHMGVLYPAMMAARGWRVTGGTRYDTVLEKPLPGGGALRLGFALSRRNRSSISNRYAIRGATGDWTEQPDWEWAEPWGAGIQVAAKGALWHLPAPGAPPDRIRDFGDLRFEPREAPYPRAEAAEAGT
ncbi:hypothetical protein HKCCE2091_00850 [Rhodobacterales bacterium HKCCE2091]|nr:hypothetical protein [Rhodobacterales bacterium HKCCE2091]